MWIWLFGLACGVVLGFIFGAMLCWAYARYVVKTVQTYYEMIQKYEQDSGAGPILLGDYHSRLVVCSIFEDIIDGKFGVFDRMEKTVKGGYIGKAE